MRWANNSTKKLWILFFIIAGVMILTLVIREINKPTPSVRVTTETKIKLPAPVYNSTISIEKTLKQRRSIRRYKDDALTLQQVSQLLWAAQGITSPNGFRTAPSAGGLYPLEIYLVSGNVLDLPAGVYHYLPAENTLELLIEGDKRAALRAAALHQRSITFAPANIVMTAVYARTTKKYGPNGKKYVHMEVGHAAQNVCLQAVSLGLGAVTVGAIDEPAFKAILTLPEEETPLYIIPVGKI
ncbi:nitroreductase [Legionella steigerwaltii]|uniref:Nitroreductase n=1 Tax=Legionella steigerwaltii TaxID=460 RepID=A0A378LAU8_9GAMM|nr:SagB/ThcOx family dehydrogenase [Legionella steigerwaltii]KTD77732.1 nitroreductase [Legionella steigerwaltii]STY23042.1 nitroreductase [Legionella steigerwaltii]